MDRIILGSHVSFNKNNQLLGSLEEALSYGANTFMFYTGAPQNTMRSNIDNDITKKAHEKMIKENINKENIIAHAPYIINLANPKNTDFGISFLKAELKRIVCLGFNKIVLHPGSHVGIGTEEAVKNIIFCLNKVLEEEANVQILLETMAGKGSEVGTTFEEIKQIMDGVIKKDKVKVCLDTCHISDSGYNLNNFDKVLDEFDSIIGLENLLCVHINDSKNERGAHKDRHANFGFGEIGFDNLLNVIYHPKLKDVPKILETPYVSFSDNDNKRIYPPYKFEIEMIKNKAFNKNLLEDIREYYK
jgi:apurinic endonuclease (APN1)